MIEFLRHATGLCGEGHPNLLMLAGGGLSGIVLTYKYCWCWLRTKFNRNHSCTHETK